jgi:ABC-type Zn uptake system ZnuABC Zn-binding protein ZnuA
MVVCSFLPMWVFTKNVVGDRKGVEVDVLIPGHQGPHDYALTPGDLKKINRADLLVANGLYLEEFLTDAAKQARPGLKIVEAAQAVAPIHLGDEHEADGEHRHGHGDINPHAFASPRDAAKMAQRIAEALAGVDPEGAGTYKKNAEQYAARLEALADEFRAAVRAAENKKVVTFHNAFDYLARDSGLQIVGVIETTPGQAPSAGELAGLVKTIREAGAAAIFSEPQFSPRVARVLSEETGVLVYSLDPAATGELDPGIYEQVMRKNLDTLKKALGVGG